MAESAAARPLGDNVVRPFRRGADHRMCARPGCASAGTATLTFQYEDRSVTLAELSPSKSPETYDLCAEHADRTKPPYGWSLRDDRPATPPSRPTPPSELGSDKTVRVLAAALRGDTGVESDLLGMPDEDVPQLQAEPEPHLEFEPEPEPEPAVEPTRAMQADQPTLDADAEAPAPGWQVPAARR